MNLNAIKKLDNMIKIDRLCGKELVNGPHGPQNVGKWKLSYASIYGGYIVEEII